MGANEKELFAAILTAVGIIGAVVFYFIVSVLRQQRRYRQLAQAKITAEINTLEKERIRIAADLHDEVGPLLSAIKLQINNLEGSGEVEHGIIQKSSRYIDDVISRMREISNDLLPNVLVRKGLAPAIVDFIGKVKGAGNLSIHFDHSDIPRLDTSVEVNVYRLVQEIIHNTVKHAAADKLAIELKVESGKLRLATADNGKGFNFHELLIAKGGHGLLNLQSRADMLGGSLHFDSAPGKGTRYLFEIPVKQTT
jgi:signal transduction histidine kinase